MNGFKVEVKDYSKDLISKNNINIRQAVQDVVLDLSSVAVGSAPHFKGRLEKGISHEMFSSNGFIEGKVGVSVMENGFDYGVYRHDHPFNLGAKSLLKQGGKSGISGKSFGVGDGFITNPLEANSQAYIEYIDKQFKKICD